jgi:hemolysin activation/secretion protein
MMNKKTIALCTVAFFMTGLPPALAQNIPGAGQLLNQQQQQQQMLPAHPNEAETPAVKPPVVTEDKSAVRVLVKDFRFTGAKGIASDDELQGVVAASVGKELSFSGLQAVAESVTDYLKKKGWPLAHAYLPKQDVTEGHIEIAIVQGHVESSGAEVVAPGARVSEAKLKSMVDSALPNGGASPSQEDLERGVLLIDDMPGMSAHATLARGAEPDSTHLRIEAQEGPVFTGGLNFDNFGNRYTGMWEILPALSVNDPFGFGDQLTLSGSESTTSGLDLYQAGYSLPIGSSGLRLSLSYSYLDYNLDKDLAKVDADGTAQNAGANISYPVIRTRATSLWAGLGYGYKGLVDNVSNARTSNRKVNEGTVNLVATHNDGLGGGGVTTALMTVTAGDLDRSGVASDLASDRAMAHSDGGFTKVTGSLARLQHVYGNFALFGAVRGQLADKNLDSSEKFILGGPVGVRAYPVGEGTGDDGWVGNLELRYDVPGVLPYRGKMQLVGFADAGGIRINHDNWTGGVTTATGDNSYTLAGAGLGVNMSFDDHFALRGSWARAIGSNPGRTTTGDNADGRDRNNEFWLQLLAQF